MAYFNISNGLRGGYMPDNSHILRFDTRKELKAYLLAESRDMREAHGYGGSKRIVAAIAAQAWKNRKGYIYPYVIPFGRRRGDYPFGLFVGAATRTEYLEHCKEEGF